MSPSQTQKVPVRPGVSRVLRAAEMPAAMLSALEAGGVPRGAVLAALPADLSARGEFDHRWLVICRDRLAVLSGPLEAERFEPGARELYAGLNAIEYRGMVGGGLVLTRRGEEQREMVRCSRAADRAIQAALAKLRSHLELEKGPAPGEAEGGKPAEEEEPGGRKAPEDAAGGEAGDEKKAPPPEALAEIPPEKIDVFLGQLEELGEQRYCATCGLPLKQDSSVCPACVSKGRTFARLIKLLLEYRGRMIVITALMVLLTIWQLVPPYLKKFMVDRALVPEEAMARGPRMTWLVSLLLVWALSDVVVALCRVFQGRLSAAIGARVSRDMRSRIFRHLEFLSLGYFDRHKTGALMSRVGGDTRMLEHFMVDGISWTTISILQAILITAVLFWMNWRLALLVILPAPVLVIFTRLIWHRIMARFRRLWEVMSRMSAILNDSLRGVRVVKAFGQEEQEIGRFEASNYASCDALVKAEQTWITLTPFLNLIMATGALLVWLFGGKWIIEGASIDGQKMTLGTLMAFSQYLPMLYGPLQIMTRINQWLTRSMTAAERLFEILDTQPEVAEAPDAVAMPRIEGRLQMRDVVFGYEKHTPVIKHVNLDIAAGEMIGLVGHSGAGKSTTINLATRLYDVDEGQVLIDGVDVRKIRLDDLRRQTGVVLQETFLFSGTIHENIAYAKPDAKPEEIISAAKLANAHEFVMNRADGYDSEVEEGGGNFSSGEKQRLAIARAILHDPRILILDEATSSVDTKTEKQIQEAITRLTAGRTTIAIAHRLSTLSEADRLVVLDKGEVNEVGTHQELVEKKGIYHELVKTQTEMTSVMAVGG